MRHPCPNIYIVDDDESVRVSLDRLLSTEGLRSTGFESAEDFLAFAERRNDADLTGCAILDVELPKMKGLELMQLLKQSFPQLRIVLISGSNDWRSVDAAAKASGAAFLKKPFDDAELLAAIGATERSTDAENRRGDSDGDNAMSLDGNS